MIFQIDGNKTSAPCTAADYVEAASKPPPLPNTLYKNANTYLCYRLINKKQMKTLFLAAVVLIGVYTYAQEKYD